MKNNIQITRLTDFDNKIAKAISVDGNKLHKESSASVKNGEANSAEYKTFEIYRDYLTNIPGYECLVLGKFKHGITARIVGSKEAQNVAKNMYNRSLENFGWHEGYQLLCIDYDGAKLGDLTPEQVIAIIDVVLPGFADITKVLKYSSGAWIHNDEHKLLSTSNGFHIYFMIKKPDCIAKIFKGSKSILHRKLWLNGHGYIKNSKPRDRRTTAVTQMERSIYDNCIFSPERILFEAKPILKTFGLYKEKLEAFIVEGKNDCLDLSEYEELTKEEEKKYFELVRLAKEENENTQYMIESRQIFKDHVREKIENGKYKDRKEYKGLTTEEIIEREYEASKNAILMQDHEIRLASGVYVTTEEILQDPKKYHGMECYDPHEPEYSTKPIAIIYTDQKVPIIYSQAHGGIIYRLLANELKKEPDFFSNEYWLENFYMVVYDKKDEIYHIIGNKIEKYSHSGFNHKFSGYFTEIEDGENTKKIPMTKWWMHNINKKNIAGDGFAPGQPIIYEEHGALVINEYVPEILRYGFEVPSEEEYEEAALPFITHIRTMIHNSDEAEILLDWFSYIVQFPNERPMFSPLILSQTRGVGKDMTTDILTSLIGHKFAKKSSIEELSKGSGWGDVFYQTKIITVSECGSSTDRYTAGNNIKSAITDNNMSMNLKGKDIKNGKVYCGIIFFSNSLSPFRFDDGDRRFFVTRCDWKKEEADEYKINGYFDKLASHYSDNINLNGLYYYLLNREIKTNMKGDAPMTSTKEILMKSEPNDTEQFFNDLKKHPCKYWTKGMIDKLYFKECGGKDINDGLSDNKQYNHFVRQMLGISKPIKVKGTTVRLKTFTHQDAGMENDYIRKHIEYNWGKTTDSLHPINEDESISSTRHVLDDYYDDGIKTDSLDSKDDEDFEQQIFHKKDMNNPNRFVGITI